MSHIKFSIEAKDVEELKGLLLKAYEGMEPDYLSKIMEKHPDTLLDCVLRNKEIRERILNRLEDKGYNVQLTRKEGNWD